MCHKWEPLTSPVPSPGHTALFWCERCGAVRRLHVNYPETAWVRAVGDGAWSEVTPDDWLHGEYAACPMRQPPA